MLTITYLKYRDERTRTSGKLVPKTSAIATRRHPVKIGPSSRYCPLFYRLSTDCNATILRREIPVKVCIIKRHNGSTKIVST